MFNSIGLKLCVFSHVLSVNPAGSLYCIYFRRIILATVVCFVKCWPGVGQRFNVFNVLLGVVSGTLLFSD